MPFSVRARLTSIAFHAALLFSITSLGLAAPPGVVVTRDGESEPIQVITPVGTTFDDLIRQGVLDDPRAAWPERDAPTAVDLDPGTAPEGDYMGWATFTRDGARLLLTNRGTNNVTVYDAATRAALASIDVGTYPAGLAVTDDYAVIACAFSDEVWVIDLEDYSTAAVFPVAEQPWVVRISPDQTKAYVSCDIPDALEVIDLSTLAHTNTFYGFPIWLSTYTWGSENGRNSVRFSTFEVTPDGQHLVVPNGTDALLFVNAATGDTDYSVPMSDPRAVRLYGDGLRAVAVCTTSSLSAHQVDLASHTLTASVTIPGYTLSTLDVGVNQDGTKAFLGVSSNSSAFADFTYLTYTVLTSTYTPFWIGTSPDHTLAIGGQYRFSILSFATESLLGQHQGNTQDFGAVSPVGAAVVGYDPIRNEGVYFYDYSTPTSPQYRGQTPAGIEPEADCPRRVAITPAGDRAVIHNVLSGNAVILDLETLAVEATLPIGPRAQDVAVTSDGLWAVSCAMENPEVDILDLTTNTVAATVSTSTRPGVVSILPDNSRAMVGTIQGNTVAIVRLQGAGSNLEAQLPIGEIGVSNAAYGVNSDVRCSPDNRYTLVAVSFDHVVKVIDRNTNAIVATLPTGQFPLQLAFTADGEYATVTNYQSNNATILRVDGAASSVVGTFATGQGPLRLAHDPVHDRMGIGNYSAKTLTYLNPRTGQGLGTQSYAAYGNVIQVRFDLAGDPMVLTSGNAYLVYNGGSIPLPATPSYFDYAPASGRAVITMPGPDWVTIVSFSTADAPQVTTIPLSGGLISSVSPNPVVREGRIAFRLAAPGVVSLDLHDVLGRKIRTLWAGEAAAGRREVTFDRRALSAGTYFAALRVDGRRVDSRKVVVE